MHTKFNKKPYASYINDFASFNLMTLPDWADVFSPSFPEFHHTGVHLLPQSPLRDSHDNTIFCRQEHEEPVPLPAWRREIYRFPCRYEIFCSTKIHWIHSLTALRI